MTKKKTNKKIIAEAKAEFDEWLHAPRTKVIIEKLPADARRNLAKLERRKAGLKKPDDNEKAIRIIYRDEGADACLRCCKHYKMTPTQMLTLLAKFEAH